MNRPSHHFDFDAKTSLAAPHEVRTAASKRKLLLVDDDYELSRFLCLIAEASGYETSHTPNGREAIEIMAALAPDILLLEWSVQGMSGIEMCQRLRASPSTSRIAIIMITCRGDEEDRVQGLTSGADDYMVKPFSPTELFARMKAILRRRCPESPAEPIAYGDILLDPVTHRVARAGKAIPLRPREFNLLRHLIFRPHRVVSHDSLLRHVWEYDSEVEPGAVTQTVSRLRRALRMDGLADPIRTIRSQGYSLDLEQA